jgi:DNA-directed RNA polymerase subunit RPC12/RpoP
MTRNVVRIPTFENQKDLFSYLRKNADKIIGQKKALPTITDNLEFGYSISQPVKTAGKKDSGGADASIVDGELPVDIIGNMAGWCDCYMDVMIKDNWNKSISDVGASGQKLIYHLKNHGTGYQYTTDSIIGKDPTLYVKMIDLSQFPFKSDIKKAQALMMSSVVVKEYDEKCYFLYRDKQIKQHSIGLQYIKIYLCINSTEEEDTMYKENWDKYYPQVINKDKVDSRGYFWAVTESRILEVSAVLFGANELTPVDSSGKSIDQKDEEKEMVMCPECGTEFDPDDATETDSAYICTNCSHEVSKSANIEDTPPKPSKDTPVQPSQQTKEVDWDKIAKAINL